MDVRLTDEQSLLFETAGRIGVSVGTDTPQALESFDDEKSWQTLADSGLLFYGMGRGQVRFVTSFQTTSAEVDEALSRTGKAIAVSA